VTISRAAGTMTFPSEFMLVAAMNPTPDGKMPAESRSSPREIQNYLGRISGPLLDRIDLHVEVPAVPFGEITSERNGEASAEIRRRVIAARQRQQERFKSKPRINCNARMGSREIKSYCALDESTLELLKFAMSDLKLSARGFDSRPESCPHHRRPGRLRSHHRRPSLRGHPVPLARSPVVDLTGWAAHSRWGAVRPIRDGD
jgi:magnesium chelatase family protein